jgi:hypothetical protein
MDGGTITPKVPKIVPSIDAAQYPSSPGCDSS